MQVSVYEAKARLSKLIEAAEAGREVIVARRRKPVARIVPFSRTCATRVGGLRNRAYHMGEAFDDPASNETLARDFGL